MLVSSIVRFNNTKNSVQKKQSTNSFHGVQDKRPAFMPSLLNNLKTATRRLNVLS